ncbi:trypsin-like peptidase domain-containing protein [Streptomyces sp. NPDC050535]|uniref:trypsin-like peptidase domain-containing protein n=1 Tax=Streptomyces sp. NPDC050535 TaxID=3365626 RepID=UPI003795FB4A
MDTQVLTADTYERVLAARRHQYEAAAERYVAALPQREAVERRTGRGMSLPDTESQLQARAEHLISGGALPMETVMSLASQEKPGRRLLERIIGASKDLQAVNFLSRGSRAAATVGRVSLLDNGRVLPLGTAFLVSPDLLMTNHHVLPDADMAARVVVEFGAETGIDNTPAQPASYRLLADFVPLVDEDLDFSLVRVGMGADGRPPGARFGWNRLIEAQGKLVIGESVNVVGHPSGRLKEIAIRRNELRVQLEDFLHYDTDTEPGNSGSPVFNDQWEVVALHHAGVARKDDQGRQLRRDGTPVQSGDPDDLVDWAANEGARVSRVVARLRTSLAGTARENVLGDLGLLPDTAPAALPATEGLPSRAAEAAPRRRGLRGRTGAFAGRGHLLFLHGRGQEKADPEHLRRSWTSGLNRGLTLAGLPTVDPVDVWLPFYGNRAAGTSGREALLADESALGFAPAAPPTDPTTRVLYEQLVREAAVKAGMPEELLTAEEAFSLPGGASGALRRSLAWLAARTDLDALFVSAVLGDVARYLDNRETRQAVLDAVRESVPDSGSLTIVAHSLGTVVAMDLLTQLDAAVDVRLLITVGSPLGLDSVYERLLAPTLRRPERVGRWDNVWCPADPVTIGCPLRPRWGGDLHESVVTNPREQAHSVHEYLAHPDVARAVARGLLP